MEGNDAVIDKLVIEAMKAFGLTVNGACFEFMVRGARFPIEIDLSACDPSKIHEQFIQQVFEEGQGRGRAAFKYDVQQILGIRS